MNRLEEAKAFQRKHPDVQAMEVGLPGAHRRVRVSPGSLVYQGYRCLAPIEGQWFVRAGAVSGATDSEARFDTLEEAWTYMLMCQAAKATP